MTCHSLKNVRSLFIHAFILVHSVVGSKSTLHFFCLFDSHPPPSCFHTPGFVSLPETDWDDYNTYRGPLAGKVKQRLKLLPVSSLRTPIHQHRRRTILPLDGPCCATRRELIRSYSHSVASLNQSNLRSLHIHCHVSIVLTFATCQLSNMALVLVAHAASLQELLQPVLAFDRLLQDLQSTLYNLQDLEDTLEDFQILGGDWCGESSLHPVTCHPCCSPTASSPGAAPTQPGVHLNLFHSVDTPVVSPVYISPISVERPTTTQPSNICGEYTCLFLVKPSF